MHIDDNTSLNINKLIKYQCILTFPAFAKQAQKQYIFVEMRKATATHHKERRDG